MLSIMGERERTQEYGNEIHCHVYTFAKFQENTSYNIHVQIIYHRIYNIRNTHCSVGITGYEYLHNERPINRRWRISASIKRIPFNRRWRISASLYYSNRHSMPFHVVFSESDWDIRRQSYDIMKTAARTRDWSQRLWLLYSWTEQAEVSKSYIYRESRPRVTHR